MREGRPPNARRSHNKSRTGCSRCKQRKLKCDEKKPVCQRCDDYGSPCSFLQTHPVRHLIKKPSHVGESGTPLPDRTQPPSLALPTPVQLSQLPPANFTILDLELLHFWVTKSAVEFADFEYCIDVFHSAAIQLAFEFDFLMHEILSLSALHLSRLRPDKSSAYRYASDSHAAMGLSLSQKHILNLNPSNCHACFAFSSITFIHAWASEDRSKPSTLFFRPSSHEGEGEPITWVKLHRGTHSILKTLFSVIQNGPFKTMFVPWNPYDKVRHYQLLDEDEQKLNELAEAWNSPSVSETHKAVLSRTLKGIRRVLSMFTYCTTIGKVSCVMAWFSSVDEDFLEMMGNKIPEALLIVAYFSVVLKRLQDYSYRWWLEGVAENLLRTILLEIGEGWERWTSWPIDQMMGRKEIQNFPGNDPTS